MIFKSKFKKGVYTCDECSILCVHNLKCNCWYVTPKRCNPESLNPKPCHHKEDCVPFSRNLNKQICGMFQTLKVPPSCIWSRKMALKEEVKQLCIVMWHECWRISFSSLCTGLKRELTTLWLCHRQVQNSFVMRKKLAKRVFVNDLFLCCTAYLK